MKLTMIVAILWSCTISHSHAGVLDTFTRIDDAGDPTDSLGSSELGGYDYVERNNGGVVGNNASIDNEKLYVFGDLGVLAKGTGGAYLNGYDYADVSISMDLTFAHSSAVLSTDRFANTFLLQLRSRPGQLFGTTNPDHNGLIGIELGANGDVLIRQQNNALTGVTSANPFTGGSNTRTPKPGQLPMTFGNGSFDTNQDGFLGENETINFGAELSGTTLKLFVNGTQIGSDFTVALTGNPFGNGVGLHKNRVSSGFEIASDVLIDNLNVTPVPEPASLTILGLTMLLMPSVNRRRHNS